MPRVLSRKMVKMVAYMHIAILHSNLPIEFLLNIENLNAVFINEGMPQGERLEKLNRIAIEQMKVLGNMGGRRLLT